MGSAPVNLPPAKPVDIQFIGQVGLVQGVENAVVHQLNPVYHPLELQTQKKYKKGNEKHTHGQRPKKKDRKKGLTGLMSMLRRSPSQYSMYFQRKNMQSQGPACLGRSIIGLLQRSKQGNLLLVTLWNAALMIGILLQTGRWRVSGEVLPQTQSIESRISIRLCMRLMQYTKQCFPEHAGMNTCMKKKETKPPIANNLQNSCKSIVKKQQQKSGGSQITCNVGG